MKKLIMAIALLLSLASIAHAENITINVTVIPYVPPPPFYMTFLKGMGSLILAGGAIIMLLETFVLGSEEKKKVERIIYGLFGVMFTVLAITVLLAL